jgi:hypothetical protein
MFSFHLEFHICISTLLSVTFPKIISFGEESFVYQSLSVLLRNHSRY